METLRSAIVKFRGLSVTKIHRLITEAKIQGRRGATRGCPLARYCHLRFGGTFIVGRKHVYRQAGDKIEKVATPSNMALFIRDFDFGEYPELEAPARTHGSRSRAGRTDNPTNPNKKRYPVSLAKEAGRFD